MNPGTPDETVTAHDVRTAQFTLVKRGGYDTQEVDAFLDQVAETLDVIAEIAVPSPGAAAQSRTSRSRGTRRSACPGAGCPAGRGPTPAPRSRRRGPAPARGRATHIRRAHRRGQDLRRGPTRRGRRLCGLDALAMPTPMPHGSPPPPRPRRRPFVRQQPRRPAVSPRPRGRRSSTRSNGSSPIATGSWATPSGSAAPSRPTACGCSTSSTACVATSTMPGADLPRPDTAPPRRLRRVRAITTLPTAAAAPRRRRSPIHVSEAASTGRRRAPRSTHPDGAPDDLPPRRRGEALRRDRGHRGDPRSPRRAAEPDVAADQRLRRPTEARAGTIFDIESDPTWSDDAGPPTEAMPAVDTGGDRFFDELRSSDEDGLGPLDDDTDAALTAFFESDDDDDESWRRRFGGRG